jgi:hypothetical protein
MGEVMSPDPDSRVLASFVAMVNDFLDQPAVARR